MMKKILLLATLLLVASCVSSGNKSWDNAGYKGQAQTAPSQLTKEALNAQVYTPYVPPGETAQTAAPGAAVPSEFDVMIGKTAGTTTAAIPQPVQAVPPGLPPVKVALLLPLSGQHADLGQAMLQAAQLALFDMGYKSFELMPRDTKGKPAEAANAAQSAVAAGAQLILGPVFAAEVRAVKPVLGRSNVNMVSFSTDWTLAGGNTFIMGFTPFGQVERIAHYAASAGYTRIGIFAPNTEYGNAVVSAFNSLSYSGVRATKVERFTPGNEDAISEALRSFTNYDERAQMTEARRVPLEEKLKKNPNDTATKKALQELEIEASSHLPFQAVLLPVGGEDARSIASLLSYYDVSPDTAKRLGTGLWDDDVLATEPALRDSWFAAPSPRLREDFESRYRQLYGVGPQRLATLAYDATALAAVLAKKGFQEQGRPAFDHHDLTNPNGFAGIDGIFRFRPDGLAERGLAVLEYRKGGISEISASPSTFQRMDY